MSQKVCVCVCKCGGANVSKAKKPLYLLTSCSNLLKMKKKDPL